MPSIFCLVMSLRLFFSFFRRSLSRSVFSRSRSPTPTPFFMKLNILDRLVASCRVSTICELKCFVQHKLQAMEGSRTMEFVHSTQTPIYVIVRMFICQIVVNVTTDLYFASEIIQTSFHLIRFHFPCLYGLLIFQLLFTHFHSIKTNVICAVFVPFSLTIDVLIKLFSSFINSTEKVKTKAKIC